jgi:hypothetical protein
MHQLFPEFVRNWFEELKPSCQRSDRGWWARCRLFMRWLLVDSRTDGSSLYVLWRIALINIEQPLAFFDLNRREVIADRRVDPNDAS